MGERRGATFVGYDAEAAMTKRSGLFLTTILLVLAGCGFPRTPDEQATWFFRRGESWIVDALRDTKAGDAKVEAARSVFQAREPEVTTALARFFEQQRAMLATIATGASTDELLARQQDFEEAHVAALRAIGGLHEAVALAVGAPAWQAAREHMRERVDEWVTE
jgi:hypothetical protein